MKGVFLKLNTLDNSRYPEACTASYSKIDDVGHCEVAVTIFSIV